MKAKHILSMCLIALSVNVAVAQNSKVQSARLAYNDALGVIQGADISTIGLEDLDKIKTYLTNAVEYIEPATKHEKTSVKEKTWRYRGDIYQLLARFSDKEGFAAITAEPLKLGAESYMKALELDTKGSYKKENTQGLAIMENIAVNAGINKYNTNDFAGAFKNFDAACLMAEKMEIVDTTAVFNAGLSADRSNDYANAAKYYRKAIDLNFPDPALYKFLYDATVNMGNKEEALKILKEGREKHPNDQGLLIDEVNVYLADGKLEEALANLEQSVKNDPDNAVIVYSQGSVFDNLGKTAEARTAYERALELNPDYFEANYNLGASYYNEAAAIIKEVNLLPLNATTKMKEGMDKANGLFATALPYLEKAHELNGEDADTIQSLKEIYVRLKMNDKYEALK